MDAGIEEIRVRERAVITAIFDKDATQLEALLHPGFIYTASEIGHRSRQEWLDGIATYRLDKFEIVDMEIDVYGEAAVVHARIVQDATIQGVPREGSFLITDTWVCTDSGWQLVSRTSLAEHRAS